MQISRFHLTIGRDGGRGVRDKYEDSKFSSKKTFIWIYTEREFIMTVPPPSRSRWCCAPTVRGSRRKIQIISAKVSRIGNDDDDECASWTCHVYFIWKYIWNLKNHFPGKRSFASCSRCSHKKATAKRVTDEERMNSAMFLWEENIYRHFYSWMRKATVLIIESNNGFPAFDDEKRAS